MIPQEIKDYVLKDKSVKIVRDRPEWLQLLKSEETDKDKIIYFCSKFSKIRVLDTDDYIHIS